MMAGLNHEPPRTPQRCLAIDLEVTSNRPDCLGHIGIAREVGGAVRKAAQALPLETAGVSVYRLAVKRQDPHPTLAQGEGTSPQPRAPLASPSASTAPDLCPRYTARVIRGVKVGSSPAWLVQRLATIGQPAINNVVDITNYVLMECGQPLHAFDLAKLAGRRDHRPRGRSRASSSRRSTTRRTRSSASMCVIADAQRPVALGGVMGGADTEVTPATADVLIEVGRVRSAFDPHHGPQAGLCTAIRRIASSAAPIPKGRLGQPPLLRADSGTGRRRDWPKE